MSFQIKPLKSRRGKGKKGISVMIGYVLLVAFAVIIAIITYGWIKTYVPTESIECADGISIFIKGSNFDEDKIPNTLTVLLKNNGRFTIDGYFAQITNESSQEIANIDLAQYLATGGTIVGNRIFVPGGLTPDEELTSVFELPDNIGEPLLISVTPFREEVFANRERVVTCGDSKITHTVGGGASLETPGGLTPQCDDNIDNDGDSCVDTLDNDCNDVNDTTESGSVCSSCPITESTEATCDDSLDNDCDGNVDCLDSDCAGSAFCATLPECSDGIDNNNDSTIDYPNDLGCSSANDDTESYCGDNITDSSLGEECDDGNTNDNDDCTNICKLPYCGDGIRWYQGSGTEGCDDGNNIDGDGCSSACILEGSVNTCEDYCQSIGYGGTPFPGSCEPSSASCTGTPESGGDSYCAFYNDPQRDTCCCYN